MRLFCFVFLQSVHACPIRDVLGSFRFFSLTFSQVIGLLKQLPGALETGDFVLKKCSSTIYTTLLSLAPFFCLNSECRLFFVSPPVCGGEDENAAGPGGHSPEPLRPHRDCARLPPHDSRGHALDQVGGHHI